MMTALTILSQAVPDISGVPADFVKYFMIMTAFVAAVGGVGALAYSRGKKASGQKDDPVHVHQPLAITKHPEYAPKEATERDIQAVTQRLNEVMEAGGKRGEDILTAIHAASDKMTATMLREVKAVHDRINPLERQMGAHEGKIQALEHRISDLWKWLCEWLPFAGKPKK